METDHGNRPATPASPARPAHEIEITSSWAPAAASTSLSTGSARANWSVPPPDLSGESDDAASAEIEAEFRRMLSGLRRLPRGARAAALRAARNYRYLAHKALREKRQCDRQAAHRAWRDRLPAPKPPG
jgi:hypothetical protein